MPQNTTMLQKFSVALILLIAVFCGCLVEAKIKYTSLTWNKPFSSQVLAKGKKAYFKLGAISQALSASSSLSITVNPIRGDPDIFLAFSSKKTPSRTHHDIESTRNGADYIVIGHDTPKYKHKNGIFLCVEAFTETEFVVTGHYSNASVSLTLGQPQIGALPGRQATLYEYKHDSGPFTISATDVDGDPDIFVSTSKTPTIDDHEWSRQEWGGDVLTIDSSDEHFKKNAIYYISISCFTEHCAFSVTITKGETTTILGDHVPFDGVIQDNKIKYFKFQVGSNDAITVDVKRIKDDKTDPDVYISTKLEHPTRDHNQWHSRDFGEDVIHISSLDPNYSKGWFYIGVDAFNPGLFTISAFSSPECTPVSNGQSVNSLVEKDTYKYFYFKNNDQQENLSISAKTLIGSVQMFVSSENTRPQNVAGKFQDMDAREIEKKAPTVEGMYFIGVKGVEKQNNFTLTVSANQTIKALAANLLDFGDRVPQRLYRYFSFDPSDYKDFDLSFTAIPQSTGDVDVYVSQSAMYPTITQFEWQSIRGGAGKADSVVVEASDPKRDNSRPFYIGVHGFTEALFSIIVLTSTQSTSLLEKQQYHGDIRANELQFFEFTLERFGNFRVDLRHDSDVGMGLYVDFFNKKPTKYDYLWKAESLLHPNVLVEDALSGKYYIGISSDISCSFTITAYTESAHLFIGQSTREIVAAHDDKTYKVNVPRHAEDLLVTVTLLRGHTELYVNSKNEPPSSDRASFTSKSYPGNLVYASKSDWRFKTGIWNIKIHAKEEAEFYLALSSGVVPNNLKPSIPRIYFLENGQFAQFELFSHEFEPGMTVYVRVIEGGAAVVASQDFRWPTRDRYDWSVSGSNRLLVLNIPASEMKEDVFHIKLRIYNSADHLSKLEVTLEKYGEPPLAPEEQDVIVETADKHSTFKLIRPDSENLPLFLSVDSCTSSSAPSFQLRDLESHAVIEKQTGRTYRSVLYIPEVENTTQILLEVNNTLHTGDENNSFSVRHGLKDVTPLVYAESLSLDGEYTSEGFKLFFPRAYPAAEDNQPTISDYKVYILQRNSTREMADDPPNMETPCSIEREGTALEAHVQDKDRHYLEATFFVDYKLPYAINVVATDSLGNKLAYEKAYIIYGRFVHSLPSSNTLWIIFIVIPSSVGIFLGYCILGVLIKFALGYRGVEAIPNYQCWACILAPLKALALFVFTCGESASQQKLDLDLDLELEDEDIEELADEQLEQPETEEEDNEVPVEQRPSRSGYGKV